jgi:hypothetical protein
MALCLLLIENHQLLMLTMREKKERSSILTNWHEIHSAVRQINGSAFISGYHQQDETHHSIIEGC